MAKEINMWLLEAVRLEETGQSDAALDIVYDHIDDLLIAGNYSEVDQIFKDITASNYSSSILIGILCITFYANEHLPSRAQYIIKLGRILKERGIDNRMLIANIIK